MTSTGQTASEWWAWDIVALVASQLVSGYFHHSSSQRHSLLLQTRIRRHTCIPISTGRDFLNNMASSFRTGHSSFYSVRFVSVLFLSSTLCIPYAALAIFSVNTKLAVQALQRKPLYWRGCSWPVLWVYFCLLSGIDGHTCSMRILVCLSSLLRKNSTEWTSVAAVVSLVASIIPLLAMFQVFDANAAITSGILRARGKQIMGAVLNIRCVVFFPALYPIDLELFV